MWCAAGWYTSLLRVPGGLRRGSCRDSRLARESLPHRELVMWGMVARAAWGRPPVPHTTAVRGCAPEARRSSRQRLCCVGGGLQPCGAWFSGCRCIQPGSGVRLEGGVLWMRRSWERAGLYDRVGRCNALSIVQGSPHCEHGCVRSTTWRVMCICARLGLRYACGCPRWSRSPTEHTCTGKPITSNHSHEFAGPQKCRGVVNMVTARP